MSLTLILLAGTIGGAAVLIWARRPAAEETYHIFRCPSCGQKVRYLASKSGRASGCPRCLQRWHLPTTPQAASRGSRELVKVGGVSWQSTRRLTARLPRSSDRDS
jgi:hypothetical protein